MNVLLSHPAIQSGLIPFGVALLVGWALRPLGRFHIGLAIMAGFLASVALIEGFHFSPLNSTRKLILMALAVIPVAALLDLRPIAWRRTAPLLIILGAAAVLWLIWPVLTRREGMNLWLLALGCGAYGAWLVTSMDSLHDDPDRALSAAMALGFGIGGAALLSASAKLGQLGLALGAATGALVLLQLIRNRNTAGRMVTVSIGLLAGLVSVAAHVYAKLPWFILPLFALIPVLALIPVADSLSSRQRLILLCAATLATAVTAILWAGYLAGGLPM